MKTLIIYDYNGQVVSTMSKISKSYGLDETEIDFNIRKIVGYDLEAKKVITASKDLSDTKFNKMKDELIKKNVHLEILTGACHGINMTTPEGRMFFHMAATFAQFERDLIRERIVAGIAEAQRRGTKSGRKFKFSKYDIQTIQHMIKASVPKAEIARRFHVTTQTIFNYFTPDGEIKQRG